MQLLGLTDASPPPPEQAGATLDAQPEQGQAVGLVKPEPTGDEGAAAAGAVAAAAAATVSEPALPMEVDGEQQQREQQQQALPQPLQQQQQQQQPGSGLPADLAATGMQAGGALPMASGQTAPTPAVTATGSEAEGAGQEEGDDVASMKQAAAAAAAPVLPGLVQLAPRVQDSKKATLQACWESLRQQAQVGCMGTRGLRSRTRWSVWQAAWPTAWLAT